jgi:hypothetical protein
LFSPFIYNHPPATRPLTATAAAAPIIIALGSASDGPAIIGLGISFYILGDH